MTSFNPMTSCSDPITSCVNKKLKVLSLLMGTGSVSEEEVLLDAGVTLSDMLDFAKARIICMNNGFDAVISKTSDTEYLCLKWHPTSRSCARRCKGKKPSILTQKWAKKYSSSVMGCLSQNSNQLNEKCLLEAKLRQGISIERANKCLMLLAHGRYLVKDEHDNYRIGPQGILCCDSSEKKRTRYYGIREFADL